MAMNQRLVDNYKIVTGAPAKDYNGAAMTAKWVSLKNYNHISFIIQLGAWAGGTAAVTINQATAIAGTSTKALAFSTMFTNAADTTSDTLTQTAVTSNTFNLNTANALYVIEVDAATLDVTNSFDCVTLTVATPGSNADLYGVVYALGGSRYKQSNPSSAIVD